MNVIEPKMKVSEILETYPETLSIFRSFNMKCAEEDSYADKTLEENIFIEQVNFIDILSRLDKTVHKQKQGAKPIRKQNNNSHNRIKYAVCDVCGKTSNLHKLEVLFAKKDANPQFKKIKFYEYKACLKGSWTYWLLIVLVLLFLTASAIPLYEWFISSGLKSATAWKLISFILLIVTMFLIKGISYISRSPVGYMNMETVRNLLNEGYSVAYVCSKISDMLNGDIALSKYQGVIHLTGSTSYHYSEGFQKKCTTSIKGNDIIWKMPLKIAFVKASY
ncbi:MAG: DUF1858 domain-containing protein [Prevotellaceae bacterium]|jgi:hypothetical protein|nr:DUF1858 domain-containing protein [Prevotellaceae bacterium]